jgi:hypothetical protein
MAKNFMNILVRNKFTFIFVIPLLLPMLSCSDSDFSGNIANRANESDDNKSSATSSDDGDDKTNSSDSDSDGDLDFDDAGDESKGDDLILSEDEISLLKQKCWFATSGTFVGNTSNATHASTFPKTQSGDPATHGESFDTVGGIYLEAREEPYEHGKGEKLIDEAIRWTFDGIVIAPGMHAIVKDGSGNILADTDGPYVAMSQFYAGHKTNYTNNLKANQGLPDWMKTHIETNDVQIIKLQSARYVQVSPIAGEDCDFDQE